MSKRTEGQSYISYDGKESIRVAFMIQVASFWPSLESVYEAVSQDTKFEVKVFYIDEFSVERVQMEGTRTFLEETGIPFEVYSENAIKKFLPHVAIYQPPYDASYRNPPVLSNHLKQMGIRIIHIPYGIEIADTKDARMAHFDAFVVRNSWRIYTFSELMKKEYFKYCFNRHAVRVCGLPKFDAYSNKEFMLSESVLKRIGNRKVILWKMHFPKLILEEGRELQVTPYLEEYEKFETIIENFADMFFVVMPHPMFYSKTISNKLGQQAQALIEKASRHENVFVDRTPDYRKSLRNADAIMVDRSAIMVEAGVCDVPVLYMSNPDYKEPLTPPIQMLADTYEQGTGCKDMVSFLNRFRAGELSVTDERKQVVREVLPFQDGKCGMRIKEDIENGLKREELGRIRLVLFGTGKVCSHYIKQLRLTSDERFELAAFSDNDSRKWGTEIEKIKIVKPEELRQIEFDVLVITTEQYHMEIKKQLVYDLFLDDEKIMRLDYFCEEYF